MLNIKHEAVNINFLIFLVWFN